METTVAQHSVARKLVYERRDPRLALLQQLVGSKREEGSFVSRAIAYVLSSTTLAPWLRLLSYPCS